MKKIIGIFVIIFGLNFSLQAQDNKVYDYKSEELNEKPKPTKEFIQWLKENNPKLGQKAERSSRKTTKVVFLFVVDETGHLVDIKIWRGIGQGYDEEAYDLMKKNPYLWTVGKVGNVSVKTSVYYQFDFIKNKNIIVDREINRLD